VDRAHCGTYGDRRFQEWSEDGARLLSPGIDNSTRLLYICVDTCRYAAIAGGREATGYTLTTIPLTVCLWQRRLP
jgi:hypothetical protein